MVSRRTERPRSRLLLSLVVQIVLQDHSRRRRIEPASLSFTPVRRWLPSARGMLPRQRLLRRLGSEAFVPEYHARPRHGAQLAPKRLGAPRLVGDLTRPAKWHAHHKHNCLVLFRQPRDSRHSLPVRWPQHRGYRSGQQPGRIAPGNTNPPFPYVQAERNHAAFVCTPICQPKKGRRPGSGPRLCSS